MKTVFKWFGLIMAIIAVALMLPIEETGVAIASAASMVGMLLLAVAAFLWLVGAIGRAWRGDK